RAGALSDVARRAGHHRHRLERAVRPLRAARRARHDASPFRHFVRRRRRERRKRRQQRGEGDMSARCLAAAVCGLLRLAACNKTDTTYQGWIEANLIFVAPDEVGRVQTLSVREGATVKTGEPLFTVDDDLQQADIAQVKAALTNAQQTFDRASQLARTGAGTQKDLDSATAVLRDAQARLNSSQTRLSRRKVFSPVDGTVQEIYYRPGEMVPAGRPV